jgi:DNA-binding MarR family transcriptional regulator
MSKRSFPETMDFLLVNICHLHHFRAHQLLEKLGLYRGQPPVLRALWETEGLTQTELAAQMKITPATMTKMLQRMEKAGFIYRKPDPGDQRVSRVYLTETGRSVQKDVEATWGRMNEETFANFTPEEHALLRRFLLQVRSNLLEATGEEPWE